MHFKVGRVAAKLMHSLAAAVGVKMAEEAEELCASGQCAAAAVALKLAADLGYLPSRALMERMIFGSREGVTKDRNAWNGEYRNGELELVTMFHHLQMRKV